MSIAEILFDNHLSAIDDVQAFSWSIHTLTGNVVNHILAFLGVCCDVADARSIGVVYPRYRRLVALIATIIDALDTHLRPGSTFLYTILEVDAV